MTSVRQFVCFFFFFFQAEDGIRDVAVTGVQTCALPILLVESPKPPRQRITITPPVIAAARHVVMLVTGRDKALAVARALDGDAPSPSEVPAVLVRDGVWFLDPLAAAQLPRPVPWTSSPAAGAGRT